MQNVLISIEDDAVEKVMYLLRSLSDVKIVRQERTKDEDLSFLEDAIEAGLQSGRSDKTHQDILKDLKRTYA